MSEAQEITDSQIPKLSWRNCVTSNARESLNFLMDHECIEGNRMLKDGRILLLDEATSRYVHLEIGLQEINLVSNSLFRDS
jgi:hypothetical protein